MMIMSSLTMINKYETRKGGDLLNKQNEQRGKGRESVQEDVKEENAGVK